MKKHFKLWRVDRKNFCAGFVTAFPAEPDVLEEELWLMAPILRKMHIKEWFPYRKPVDEWDGDFEGGWEKNLAGGRGERKQLSNRKEK